MIGYGRVCLAVLADTIAIGSLAIAGKFRGRADACVAAT